MKYACIARHRGEHSVRLMCRVLELSPAGYYAWRKRSPSAHAVADERLLLNVRVAHRASAGRYGAPRIHRELRDHGIRVGKKRIARLMRDAGLVARVPRRWGRTTDSAHAHPLVPNLLERQFAVGTSPLALDRVWVSDITYVPTHAGWLYLAVVLDLASRRVVGWAMDTSLQAALTIRALHMAIQLRHPGPGLIHHSDRGWQYACDLYQTALAQHGMQASMSRKGDCWDNAVAESFFATLEFELLAQRTLHTHGEARRVIFEFIESWYNRQRRHSSLEYLSPAAYEARLHEAA